MNLKGRTIRECEVRYRRIPDSIPKRTDERKSELLKSVQEGDDDAYSELILSHMRLAISIVNRYVSCFNCKHLADELDGAAIEGLIVAVDRIKQGYLSHDNVTGYIVVVIHRHISDYLRKSSLIPVPRGHFPRKGCSIYDDDSLEFLRSKGVLRQWDKVHDPRAMSELKDLINCSTETEQERRVVDLKIAGYTDKEVAKIMDMPQTAVFRLRQTLKTRFERLNRDD